MIPDGTYDAIVVDALDGPEADTMTIHLAIAAGVHRGDVVTVTADGLGRDPLDLLAVPSTLVVSDGEPQVSFEA